MVQLNGEPYGARFVILRSGYQPEANGVIKRPVDPLRSADWWTEQLSHARLFTVFDKHPYPDEKHKEMLAPLFHLFVVKALGST